MCLMAGYDANARMKIIKRWQELEAAQSMPVNLSPARQLLWNAQQLVDHEDKIAALEKSQAETKAQVAALVNGEDYFTVVGFANLQGVRLDQTTTATIGKKASKTCKSQGIKIGKATHPIYGVVNTYPREVLSELLH